MGTQNGVNYALQADPQASSILSAAKWKGKLRVQSDTFTFAGESSGEVINIAKLPAKAVVLAVIVHHAALGGSTTVKVGDSGDDDRFIAAASTASAGVLEHNDMAIGGVNYETSEETIITLTTGGAAATGQIKTQVIYATE